MTRRLFRWLNCPHPHGPRDAVYWDQVRAIARWLGTDGCSSVSQVYMAPCLEHDIHYRTRQCVDKFIHGIDLDWPISRFQADVQMLLATMSRSPARVFTPIGWVRFWGLRMAGWKAWRDNRGVPLPTQSQPHFTRQET